MAGILDLLMRQGLFGGGGLLGGQQQPGGLFGSEGNDQIWNEQPSMGYDPGARQKAGLKQGLLYAGAGLAGGQGWGQGLSQGLLGMGQGMQQGRDAYMQDAAFNMQMQQQQAEKDQLAQTRALFERYTSPQQMPPQMAGGPLANGAPPVGMNPSGLPMGGPGADPMAAGNLNGLPPQVLQAAILASGNGADPQAGLKVISDYYMNPEESGYKRDKIVLPGGTQYQDRISQDGGRTWENIGAPYDIRAASGADNTSVNVNTPLTVDAGNDKQADAIGTYYGDTFGQIMDAGRKAPTEISDLRRLQSLLDQVDTGKFTGTMVEFKSALKSIGVEPEQFGWADDVDAAQAARTLINQMVLELRNPAGGAGMPGAMSDADRMFLMQGAASLENTPGGNKMILDYAIRVQERNAAVQQLAIDYAKSNDGFLDAGFDQMLAQWSAQNPLFTEADYAAVEKAKAGGGGGGAGGPPPGVDPAIWEVMTPEERKLWQN